MGQHPIDITHPPGKYRPKNPMGALNRLDSFSLASRKWVCLKKKWASTISLVFDTLHCIELRHGWWWRPSEGLVFGLKRPFCYIFRPVNGCFSPILCLFASFLNVFQQSTAKMRGNDAKLMEKDISISETGEQHPFTGQNMQHLFHFGTNNFNVSVFLFREMVNRVKCQACQNSKCKGEIVFIYSRLSRSFTAMGVTSGGPPSGVRLISF